MFDPTMEKMKPLQGLSIQMSCTLYSDIYCNQIILWNRIGRAHKPTAIHDFLGLIPRNITIFSKLFATTCSICNMCISVHLQINSRKSFSLAQDSYSCTLRTSNRALALVTTPFLIVVLVVVLNGQGPRVQGSRRSAQMFSDGFLPRLTQLLRKSSNHQWEDSWISILTIFLLLCQLNCRKTIALLKRRTSIRQVFWS